ncbi:hypothetical protein GJAV_G00082920 [Gymnothorax javanicus]|nr:hypothetical protein GJAV_G00082920 [Gymnothorax javanicus]
MSGAAAGGASSCVGAASASSSAVGSCAVGAAGGAGVAVCWHWNSCLADENSEVWRSLCTRTLSEEALRSDILCNLLSYKGKLKSFQHALSSHDCSRNVYVKKNGFTLHRNPIAQSTDGARGKIGFTEGRHAWEIWWEGPLGTVAVIGIATKRAPMQCQGYVALLGSDDQSWGWNLVDNNLLHNGEVNGNFPQCNNAPKYQIGERIRVILDMEDKTLAFERGFEFLGVAFRGLPKACLFPAVSAVYGNTEVTMVYLGKPLDGCKPERWLRVQPSVARSFLTNTFADGVTMPLLGLSCLLCVNLWLMWNLLTPATCQSLHRPCRQASQIALCNNYQLSSVPRDLPSNITELQLNNNSIRTLQRTCLARYPDLRILMFAGNFLSTIGSDTFLNTQKIWNLSLAENNLSEGYLQTGQALRALSQLRTLDLSRNGFTGEMVSLILENLTSLEYLFLSGNSMLRLDKDIFRDLHQLKELNLERNMLFEIDGAFDHLQKLQRLNVAFNSLPCLANFQLTQLVELNASYNGIEWFSSQQDMEEVFHLETLDLSNNKLFFFPFLPTHSHIRNLLLSNNRVNFYEHLADNGSPNSNATVNFSNLKGNVSNVTVSLWDDSYYGDISTMGFLDLTGNQVNNLPQGFLSKMPSLFILKLGTNCLESLDLSSEGFSSSLYELDLSNNRLNTLTGNQSTLHELSNLTHLYLHLNDIQVLPPRLFSALPKIRTVDLSYNRIRICALQENSTTSEYSDCAVWSNIKSLRQLSLAGCSLEHVPSTAFEKTPITHLDLSNNPEILIRKDALIDLARTLQYLDLGNTGLHYFDFTPFHHLKFLNISSNYMPQIPSSLLRLDLRLLDLRNNRLTTIPSQQANLIAKRVQTLFLGGNPFNCCLLEWYRTFEAANVINTEDWPEVTCHFFSPQTYRVELQRLPRAAQFLRNTETRVRGFTQAGCTMCYYTQNNSLKTSTPPQAIQ